MESIVLQSFIHDGIRCCYESCLLVRYCRLQALCSMLGV